MKFSKISKIPNTIQMLIIPFFYALHKLWVVVLSFKLLQIEGS